jgi:tetratricopeptide (TPR) repeat protein
MTGPPLVETTSAARNDLYAITMDKAPEPMKWTGFRRGPIFAAAILLLSEPFALAAPPCVASTQLQALVKAKPTADTYTSLGEWFADQKQFHCAAGAFASSFHLQPTSASAAYLWGLSLSSAGENEQAIAPLKQAIRLDANDIRPHLVLASVLDRMKRTQEGDAEWREALAIDPQSAVALDSLSQNMVDEKNYASVIALLDKPGLEQDRSAVQSLNLGIAYAGRVQLDKAAAILREGLNNNEGSLPIANELAVVLMLLGRNEEAYSVFDLALAKHPDDQPTQILYLHTLVSSKSNRAFDYSRKLLAAHPSQWEVLYLAGVLESRKADFEQARSHLEHSVSLNPSYYQSQEELGTVLVELGNFPAARQHLEKAIALGDNQQEVNYELAKVLQRLGDTAQAQDKMRTYEELRKARMDATQAAGKAEMGDQAIAAGNPSQAASFYQQAIETKPNEPLLYYKLSEALDKTKDFVGEKIALQKAIQLDPNLAEAQNQMGYLATRTGELAQAETYFRVAVRVSPSYTVAWINLAATLASEDKLQDAKQVLSHVREIDPDNVQARQLGQELEDAHPER